MRGGVNYIINVRLFSHDIHRELTAIRVSRKENNIEKGHEGARARASERESRNRSLAYLSHIANGIPRVIDRDLIDTRHMIPVIPHRLTRNRSIRLFNRFAATIAGTIDQGEN